jgi:glutaminase
MARAGGWVSTGGLPGEDAVAALVAEAHERFAADDDGAVSTVYPALARAEASLFGISLVAADGRTWSAGDADAPFTVMSVSKPFVLALVCEERGVDRTLDLVGADATGRPFNSVEAVVDSTDGRTNPMVNSGAIATTALLVGEDLESTWDRLRADLSRFAGRELALDQEVLVSASATNHRNRELAALLRSRGVLARDPAESVELYTRQCSLSVTAHDLAVMGATLADGGVNPVTGDRVVGRAAAAATLAVMATSGMYETSGDWLARVGLPAKSGIGGGIVTAAPGKGGLGVFSPPLDATGNSVRGGRVTRFLADELGLDLFVSAPAR